MLEVDCAELSTDEELALASAISDALMGAGVALINGNKIVFDSVSKGKLDEKVIESSVEEFVRHRKQSEYYSVEKNGDSLVVHSADPVKGARKKSPSRLPPNLYKCPFCSFVSPYEELYIVHTRSHGFV